MHQDPKYRFEEGRVVNRQSGEAIPDDEPVMVFRARDIHASLLIAYYHAMITNPDHKTAVSARIADFERFAEEHPERMKEPDTEIQS